MPIFIEVPQKTDASAGFNFIQDSKLKNIAKLNSDAHAGGVFVKLGLVDTLVVLYLGVKANRAGARPGLLARNISMYPSLPVFLGLTSPLDLAREYGRPGGTKDQREKQRGEQKERGLPKGDYVSSCIAGCILVLPAKRGRGRGIELQ